ncbi:MAG TPA: hypothetical protein VN851_01605 [Thermoanaerobaculia bacterium]|nr:hypothetical protein [Thermoanaerobaculia bacterium]
MPIDRPKSRATRSALILALTLGAWPASGAEIDRIASFSAGGPPPCSDSSPEIASQPGGSFLLLWSRGGCPAGQFLALTRALRFDAAGRRLGEDVELWQGLDAVVVPLADGGFLAVSDHELGPGLSPPREIRLHRLDPLGRPVGEPVLVTSDSDEFNSSSDPRLAVAPDGTIAVVWATFKFSGPFRTMGRFYDSRLVPLTEAFPLSTAGQNVVDDTADIAFEAGGTALAIWAQFQGTDITVPQIVGRRFSSSGQPLSEVLPISRPETVRRELYPRIVAASPTGWWTAWNSYGEAGETTETHLLRLGPDAEPVAAEQSLGLPQSDQNRPALGIDGTGNALLLGRTLDGKIVARLFDPLGAVRSNPFELSEGSTPSFAHPALSDHTSAGFTVAWTVLGAATFDSADLSGAILASPCLPGGNAACLGPDGRYGVEVSWQSGTQHGTAKPLPLAGNVATFGLRNAADQDVTVLLSGSGSRDLTFAATTGAALEIRVTDKTTGAVRTFNKPAGRFASRRFSEALPSGARLQGIEIPREMTTPNPSLAPEPAVGETCVPTSRALCLLGGRFRAELLAGPYPNPALAILRTDKSGAFALPRAPETPLVTLTMIDGRTSNGHFWVYLGGLSSSGYKVRIADLSTGAAKTYANPVGRLESRADRTAF